MAEHTDTQPLDMKSVLGDDEAPASLPVNRPDAPAPAPEPQPAPQPATPKVPEPALVRGGIVAVLNLVGVIVGHELNPDLTDAILQVYVWVAPVALAWWIRRHVSPTPK